MDDDVRPRRHDLVRLSPGAPIAIAAASEALDDHAALLDDWSRQGRPFVVTRGDPHQKDVVSLGLLMPLGDGRRRLALAVDTTAIVSQSPPISLDEARVAAPAAWHPTIDAVIDAVARRGQDVRCFGSLAWAALTGLAYLTPGSDLDLLIYPQDGSDAAAMVKHIGAIEAMAPMRLDGEVIRPDGAAANWREILGGSDDVLVKSQDAVALWPRDLFLAFRK